MDQPTPGPEPLKPNWRGHAAGAPSGAIVATLGDWWQADGPLYAKLADALRGAIERGELPPGTRLPGERHLAQLLHIGRATVVEALERLRRDGWLQTEHGSGTWVPLDVRDRLASIPFEHSIVPRRERVLAGALRPDGGFVDLSSAAPVGLDDVIRSAFTAAIEDVGGIVATSDYSPYGLPPLRAAIADHLTTAGLPTRPDEVLVTSGAQQAIGLVTALAITAGDTVVVEAPTYPGAIDAFARAGAQLVFVPTDDLADNPQVVAETLRRLRPKLLYLMPGCHAITGRVLPADARAALAHHCQRLGVAVLEDNIFSDFTLVEQPPPLAAFASQAPVFTIGSLSKLVWNGLRVGWMRAPATLVADALHAKALADLGTSAIAQLAATHLLRDHMSTTTSFRRQEIRTALTAAERLLADALPSWTFTTPEGGRSLWIRLPTGDGIGFLRDAERHRVRCAPGRAFSRHAADAACLRLMYVQPPNVLAQGIDRLSRAWATYSASHRPARTQSKPPRPSAVT